MPEPFDLEALVRAARPEPAPAWVGKMDRRVAERFPSPPRWWQWETVKPHLQAVAAVGAVIVVVVAIVGLAGTANHGGDDNASGGSASSNSSGSAKAPDVPASESADAGGESAGSAATPLTQTQRKQIQSVAITLSTRPAEVEDVSDKVIRVADTLGGYIQRSSITARRSAELTVRVPSDKLEPALAQLSRIAHVSSRTQDTEDVTDQAAQLNAAVRDARAYRDSLRNRLAKATTDAQTASLRARLTRAEQRLRSRERQVAQLSRQTSYATIDVRVRGDRKSGAAAAPAGRWTPGDALHDAGRVLEVVAGVALIVGAVALPVAVLAAIAVALSRLLTRRRRERALELA
jgi:Domain of unknown function (DUF4349)